MGEADAHIQVCSLGPRTQQIPFARLKFYHIHE